MEIIFMIYICERYLKEYDVRSNITVIIEVLSGLIIDRYILKNNIINIGDSQQEKLPDIFTNDKKFGFEATRCESEMDFYHDDFQKYLDSINYDYNTYKHIDEAKTHKEVASLIDDKLFEKIKKYKINVVVDNDRIVSSTPGFISHKKVWLKPVYLNSLNKKLKKLNNGNYSGCSNVSLVLVMISEIVGIEQADIIKNIYSSIYNNYQNKFSSIYLFTTDDIFEITNKEVKLIHHYKNGEFHDLVDDVHRMLKIFKYKAE